MKKTIILTIFIFVSIISFGQKDSAAGEYLGLVKWLSLGEAEALNAKNPRPFIIDVYTDWCGWCKYMMKTTFADPGLAQYINTNYYPVRLDAETRDTIMFQGKKYWNQNTGYRSCNDLAILLLGGKMSYPTILFFNNNFKFKLIVPGYLKVTDIEPILVYTTEYVFNTTTVDDFRKYYALITAPDSVMKDTTSIRWLSLAKASSLNEAKKKKTMIFVNTSWCNSGRVMEKAVFRDTATINFVNKNFYSVKIDPETKDTLIYKGVAYTADGTYGNFNKLPVSLCNGQLNLPSIIVLDGDQNVIGNVPQFHTPADLKFILKYFSDDIYKTTKWDEYLKKK